MSKRDLLVFSHDDTAGMMEQLSFDAENHAYTYAGATVPSVSAIMRASNLGGDFSQIPPDVLAVARNRGIAVHKLCEDVDRGSTLWNDETLVAEAYRPYLAAYRKFLVESGFQSETTEEQVYHPTMKYAGTLDIRGILNGKRVIGDRKATAQMSPDTAIQVELYRLAHNAMRSGLTSVEPFPVAATFGLHLRSDGTYRLVLYHDPTVTNVARAAVRLYHEPEGKDAALCERIVSDWILRHPR